MHRVLRLRQIRPLFERCVRDRKGHIKTVLSSGFATLLRIESCQRENLT